MAFELCYVRGVVALAGPAIDAVANANLGSVPIEWQVARQKRDGDHYHITFLNKSDLQLIAEGIKAGSLPNLQPTDPSDITSVAGVVIQHLKSLPGALTWVDLGEGRASSDGGEVAFRVVFWPGGSYLRRAAQLPNLDFHITLGFLSHDVHGKCKGPSSLVEGVPQAVSVQHLLKLAQELMQVAPVEGLTDEGARCAAETALEAARGHQDHELERSALEVCCQMAGRAKDIESIDRYGRELLLLAPASPIALRSTAFAALARGRFEAALPLLKVLRGVVEETKGTESAPSAEGLEKWVESSIQKCKAKLGLPEYDPIFPGPEDRCTAEWDEAFEQAFVGHSSTGEKGVQLKFPSTAHLKNLGAATKDDKLCSPERVKAFCGSGRKIFVEEKIDGANLGISLDSNFQWRMQGRGKWVNWNTDPQFAGLQEWLEKHRATIAELLERNNDILFGEWCAARHTVKYNGLPGYFLAFDIFDWREGTFLSRRSFHTRLASCRQGPQIPAVPMLARAQAFASTQEVEDLLKTKSTFADEAVEGVYLRIDEDDATQHKSKETYLVDRCKLVRSEFQQAIESHGTWRGSGRNGLDMELSISYAAGSYPCAIRKGPAADQPATAAEGPEEIPTTLTDPRQKQTVQVKNIGPVELPRNFSFLAEDLAVSSEPKNKNQILAMASLDISLVVTLTEESPLPAALFAGSGVQNFFVPVANYHPPTSEQVEQIAEKVLAATSQHQKVMVHCGGGKGRAGTVAACLLAKFGYERIGPGDGSNADAPPTSSELIRYLREKRPGSIETERQELFLKQYISEMWKAGPSGSPSAEGNGSSSSPSSPSRPRIGKKLPKFVMMVGMIGSGKSTFAKVLEMAGGYVRINQDEQGRSGCEDALQKAVKNMKKGDVRVVLDRCNLTKDERKQWREACGNPKSEDIVCIFFNVSLASCKVQAAARTDHPTIKAGGGGRILEEQAKLLQAPETSEKLGKIVEVKSYAEAAEALRRLGFDESTTRGYWAASSSAAPSSSSTAAATAAAGLPSSSVTTSVSSSSCAPAASPPTDDGEDKEESPGGLPPDFQRWLKLALEEELGAADGESIFAAVEMILENAAEDPDAISSCIEVLNDSGAPLCATRLEEKWNNATA